MDEPLFNDRRFRARHVVAMLVHLPMTALLLWMMLEARVAGAFNIVWLYFALFVFWPGVFIAGACMEPWMEGARKYLLFRVLLIVDCALAVAPMLILAWLMLAWMLGSWPGFFKVPFQLYSISLFVETAGGALAIMILCGLYAWAALRIIAVLLLKGSAATNEDMLGELAPTGAAPPETFRPLPPEDDIMSPHFVPPPVVRPPPPAPVVVEKPEPPYHERPPELRNHFVHGEWRPKLDYNYFFVKDEAQKARCREVGWPAFEWVLRTEPSREEVVRMITLLPALAAVLDANTAASARRWLERFAQDPRSWTVDVTPRDYGDPDQITVSFAEAAKQALRQWDDERRSLVQ